MSKTASSAQQLVDESIRLRGGQRDAQFVNISAKGNAYQAEGQPVVSIDAKKKKITCNMRFDIHLASVYVATVFTAGASLPIPIPFPMPDLVTRNWNSSALGFHASR